MKTINRTLEFDVLRSIMILSAIVLHFNYVYYLGIIASPSEFISYALFNVFNFFFFTAGYMGRLIYKERFSNNYIPLSISIIKKGINILFIYFGYIAIMFLLTDKKINSNIFDLIWRHSFFTKALVTFSFVYMISPLIIMSHTFNKVIFYTLLSALYLSYIPNYSNYDTNSYFWGIFYGLGNKGIAFSFASSAIVYSAGYILCDFEKKYKIPSNKNICLLSLLILGIHSLLTLYFPIYGGLIHSRKVWLLLTSGFIYLSILIMRHLLSYKVIASFFNRNTILVLGVKSLSFFVISNLFLGLLKLPTEFSAFHNFIIFTCIVLLAYLFTSWHYYAELYFKSLTKGASRSK